MLEEFDKVKIILYLSLNKIRAEEYYNYCNIIDFEKFCFKVFFFIYLKCKFDIFKFFWLKNVFKKFSFRNRFVCIRRLIGKRNIYF